MGLLEGGFLRDSAAKKHIPDSCASKKRSLWLDEDPSFVVVDSPERCFTRIYLIPMTHKYHHNCDNCRNCRPSFDDQPLTYLYNPSSTTGYFMHYEWRVSKHTMITTPTKFVCSYYNSNTVCAHYYGRIEPSEFTTPASSRTRGTSWKSAGHERGDCTLAPVPEKGRRC